MLWRIIAWLCSRPTVANWLIRRALRTPYTHITSPNGRDVYMARFWLFNPYPDRTSGAKRPRWQFPLSIRVHHIRREDNDRHLHDHPWNARTIILRGWYFEERPEVLINGCPSIARRQPPAWRRPGDTTRLNFGEYHRISEVAPDGCWTLFFTWRYRGKWGFWVDGRKVPHDEYLGGQQ